MNRIINLWILNACMFKDHQWQRDYTLFLAYRHGKNNCLYAI